MTVLALALAVVLAGTHVLARHLRFVHEVPRSKWMSVAGGISVSYVFVHLLPELANVGEEITREVADFLEHPMYLVALLGLAVFYGIERYARGSRRVPRDGGEHDAAARRVTWFSFGTYSVYNAVIGYVLVREQETITAVVLFAVAMGVHFVVNDHSLREHHKDAYHRLGRWLVAAAIIAGAGVGLVTKVHPVVIGSLLGFIAGGVVLNVMKEELPEERESSFPAFAVGAGVYAALLVAI